MTEKIEIQEIPYAENTDCAGVAAYAIYGNRFCVFTVYDGPPDTAPDHIDNILSCISLAEQSRFIPGCHRPVFYELRTNWGYEAIEPGTFEFCRVIGTYVSECEQIIFSFPDMFCPPAITKLFTTFIGSPTQQMVGADTYEKYCEEFQTPPQQKVEWLNRILAPIEVQAGVNPRTGKYIFGYSQKKAPLWVNFLEHEPDALTSPDDLDKEDFLYYVQNWADVARRRQEDHVQLFHTIENLNLNLELNLLVAK